MKPLLKIKQRRTPTWLSLLATAAVGALGATGAAAACTYPPDTVAIPDGKTASEDDMKAASGQVNKYMASMESYISCLNAEEAGLPPEQQTDEAKALAAKRHNAAVVAMDDVAARFNEQVRAFNAKP